MSVLMNFAMFPTDKGTSVSEYVSKIIAMIRDSGFEYKLSAMGTVVETETMEQSLEILNKAYKILQPHSTRVYSVVNFDIQTNKNTGRIKGKIESIENKIGDVSK
jgi:uncharacterized protein (TIGR00106 family)